MELYESMIEAKERTMDQKRTILKTVKKEALHHYQIGLREDLRLIVRSRKYDTLQEAIAGASAEEKATGIKTRNRAQYQVRGGNKNYNCYKCGKTGHFGRECRSRQVSLAKPSGNRVNATEKHCNYCKKTGHLRKNCWTLNNRKNDKHYTAQRETRRAAQEKKSRSDSSVTSGSDEEESKRKKKFVSVAELQMTEVNTAQAGLDLAVVPIREAKGGQVEMLYDTGATVSLIKQKYLKGETPAEKTKLEITGVTGHKTCVIGKIKAHIQLRNRRIKHAIYVVRNDFPIKYQGILGSDFIRKYNAVHNYKEGRLKVGKDLMTLRPYESVVLQPKNETIVQAITDSNQVGIIEAEETRPGVFIGCCLVQPEKYL
ncbi:uncharacterized protein LOC109861084 [Pseudomyrmex gracilis]|uniref:uncharacterized protein LOC109861084 n=1 Tax=Pseudomyrmex gracilis TaxID=219809 RepID=UPI0009955967|nr:uncharacterized protein LOC109861084 [Pseudomyrmex gracilis]